MNEKILMLGIVIGTIVICAFPALAIFSLFDNHENDLENTTMSIETVKNSRTITTNKDASIDMDNIFTMQGELITDEEVPLAKTDDKVKIITGLDVKKDFKVHEKDIKDGKMVFEIIDKNGHNLFYIDYDELDLMINEKTNYQKQFVLDDDENLLRYVYLELQN